ncbi:MAG: hypothetical protein QXT06_02030 [Candidatus Bathyarchaeia archaeon]
MLDPIEPHYLQLVKNLRGIIFFSESVSPDTELKWLRRKFKYRELGFSETLKLGISWRKAIPLPKIVNDSALDSLLQASLYICPLLILKKESLNAYMDAVIACIRTKQQLSDKDLKFNIRLVNYSITDFYLDAINLALKGDLDGRRKLADRDLKRFWRIKHEADGTPLIVYIDPLLMGGRLENPIFMSLIPAIVIDFQHK